MTGSLDDFIHGYLHIQQIIPKSLFTNRYDVHHSDFCRVLMASVCNHGDCPCPHCLVSKAGLSQFSTQADIVQCTLLARVDDHARRQAIEDARCKIYKDKCHINTKFVEELLKGQSRVPTPVSNLLV
jgi:hypothetical protein